MSKKRLANTLLPAGTRRIRLNGILAPDPLMNEWTRLTESDPPAALEAMRVYVMQMRAKGLFMPLPETQGKQ